MSTSAGDPTNEPVHVTVTFNVPVDGFEESDITVNTAFASIEDFTEKQTKQVWTFVLMPNDLRSPCDLVANIAENVAADSVGSQNTVAR